MLAAVVALTVAATGLAYADDDGPELSVPHEKLADALRCHGDLDGGNGAPVLLVPGTNENPDVNFDWNYEPALAHRGTSYCSVRVPGNSMADIQVAAEYITYAIRTMHAHAHRRIDIVGYSQGGMSPRWSLKFWPETRHMVDDLVGIDPSNHGSLEANGTCTPLTAGCAPADWQQRAGSRFLRALNAGQETYAGIDYTVVYTATVDEIVVPDVPPAASSELHTGPGRISNIVVQEVCPGRPADHFSMGTTDAVGYATVIDAINHDGPAKFGRIDRSSCFQPFMPGVNPVTLPYEAARFGFHTGRVQLTYPHVPHEPRLKSYARDQRS
jgi:hypothetical protein